MGEAGAPEDAVAGFTILEPLGAGGGGVVYLAEQHRPRRRVALKVLRAACANDGPTAAATSVHARLAALASLAHPGLAGLLTTGRTADGRIYLAVEHVTGSDLVSHVRARRSGVRERIGLVARLADAIDHAHRRGVVHGDLKPANVLVDAAGQPRIIDFDLPSAPTDGHPVLSGTPAYMAPEVARGQAAGESADVYALGAILHELLTGRPPLEVSGLAPEAALHVAATARRDSRAARSLRGDLSAIVGKALADDSSRRYVSAAALADDLRRHLASQPVAARAPGAVRRSLLFARRHRRGVALAGLFTACACASVAAILVATTRARASTERLHELRLRIEGLADNYALDVLERRARDELWPADPRRLAEMDAWLEEARGLQPRPAQIREFLASRALESRAFTDVHGPDPARMLRRDFEELRDRLERFMDRADGTFAAVLARREAARTLDARTVGLHAEAWQRCVEDVGRSRAYAGLLLRPQPGLVPLGIDGRSGCAEFAVDGTGEIPPREPGSGSLRAPRAEDALVLVLVPGGEHVLLDEVSLVDTPSARPPVPVAARNVVTWPFLIGKYELTQAQCLRLLGFNPSAWQPGATVLGQPVVTELHPAERLTVEQARDGLARLGLRLPFHTEWEVAARGGEGPCGAEIGLAALECAANVADLRSTIGGLGARTASQQLQLDDGFAIHAPVGSFRANAYGLHDTLGNVGELCLDDPPGAGATTRGHSSDTLPLRVDPAFFTRVEPGWAGAHTGVRPARSLDP